MADRLENAWALVWAMGYLYIGRYVKRWWRRHRRDADYFTHMGWLAGFVLGLILILWGTAQ